MESEQISQLKECFENTLFKLNTREKSIHETNWFLTGDIKDYQNPKTKMKICLLRRDWIRQVRINFYENDNPEELLQGISLLELLDKFETNYKEAGWIQRGATKNTHFLFKIKGTKYDIPQDRGIIGYFPDGRRSKIDSFIDNSHEEAIKCFDQHTPNPIKTQEEVAKVFAALDIFLKTLK